MTADIAFRTSERRAEARLRTSKPREVLVGSCPIKLLELPQFGGRYVRDGGKPEASLAPLCHRETVLLESSLVRLAVGPNEYVHRMQAPVVDDRSDSLSADRVQPSAGQRETLLRQFRHGRREVDPPIEPRLHDMLVGGLDVGKVPGL